MAEALFGEGATVLNAYIPPAHPLSQQAELTAYEYDPEAGIALLNEIGWRDTNGDGVSEAYGVEGIANGTHLTFNYVTTTSELRRRVAEMVIDDLGRCGFRVNLLDEPVPPETFFTPSADSPIFGRQFDMTAFAWFADVLPPCHLFLTAEVPAFANSWNGFNVTGYSNEAYDAACLRALGALPGSDAYVTNHLEALRIFNEELPVVPLFTHVQAALSRPDLEGLVMDPTEPAETWNIERFVRATP
jgi:peptide/nickel transport system substrate-binding protein